jgi:hypothetical protein
LPRDVSVKIVFSGRNPAEPNVRDSILTDEAQDMEQDFESLADRDSAFLGHRNFTVNKEQKSKSTSENINNYLTVIIYRRIEKLTCIL